MRFLSSKKIEALEKKIELLRSRQPPGYPAEVERPLQFTTTFNNIDNPTDMGYVQPPVISPQLATSISTSSPEDALPYTRPHKRPRSSFETETPATVNLWNAEELGGDESELYFNTFFSGCDRYVPVFDLRFDSMQDVRGRSDLLFTTICSVGCRVLHGTSSRWRALALRTQRMLNAAIANPSMGSLETVQALLVQACYARERALLISIATRMALDLGFPEAYDTLIAQSVLRETQPSNGSEAVPKQDSMLMRQARVWLHLLVMSYILHVDAGGMQTFKFRGASLELNVLRAKIYASLPQGASLDDGEIMDLVRDAKLDIDVWFNDWIRISEKHHQEMPWFAPNLSVQRCWADNMALCRAVRASGVENVNVMSLTQKNILLMAKASLYQHLDIIIEDPRVYLESLRYAMDFVWAKNTFCCLLLLKLSALLPDEKDQQSQDRGHQLVDKASILLGELGKVAAGGLQDDTRSNTSALYLQLLRMSIQKYKRWLGRDSEGYQDDTSLTESAQSNPCGPNHYGNNELESFVPDQFVFEWDFPGLTLFSSPIDETAWLSEFLAEAQEFGDNSKQPVGMVNTGKPSRACAVCKKRKIKCDELTPSCTQCRTAGWPCPGPSQAKVVFRNQTVNDAARRNARHDVVASVGASSTWPVSASDVWKRPVSPPTRDRAATFFMRQFVFDCDSVSNYSADQNNHEYLPGLILNQQSAFGLLNTTVAAAGFAALANAGNAPVWRTEAFRLYHSAIGQLQTALEDPIARVSDETLGAVLLMGTFETIVSADMISMKAFSQHVLAASKCIEMRGPTQFQSSVGLKLFMHSRRNMITTCHQLQEPIPDELSKWSQWAENVQIPALVPVNHFCEINKALASVRSELKYQRIIDPTLISNQLLPIDKMFEEWAQTLPSSWEYKSYRSIGPHGIPSGRYDLQYDVYSDPWIASLWNCYRVARLLVHESIIVATIKYGTKEQKDNLQSSVKVLAAMADGICHSAAYHFGYQQRNGTAQKPKETTYNPTPGAFLLVWPLFFAGIQRTSPPDQREWVAKTIRRIGSQIGLQVAMTMAQVLDNNDLSFSHNDAFLLGEWHPN
ncbi:hypothetical protein FSARC_11488 [Fusarium sarcochroum]|uniref:Zn(2)-C6 fungal-type domain-containing protein n=1 Tax=Fusarium sarcochroum TaxID=1208366 RepID=A0A8H4X0F9_9HYPO|nr:hypothetical protein FSARC_11488 [Fusarium sarcochroum]